MKSNHCGFPPTYLGHTIQFCKGMSQGASLVAQRVKNPPAKQEMRVQSLDQEDPLKKGIATYSSILAWWIPWTKESGGLQQSMRLQRVGHNWATKNTHISHMLWSQTRMPIPLYCCVGAGTYPIWSPVSLSVRWTWSSVLMATTKRVKLTTCVEDWVRSPLHRSCWVATAIVEIYCCPQIIKPDLDNLLSKKGRDFLTISRVSFALIPSLPSV